MILLTRSLSDLSGARFSDLTGRGFAGGECSAARVEERFPGGQKCGGWTSGGFALRWGAVGPGRSAAGGFSAGQRGAAQGVPSFAVAGQADEVPFAADFLEAAPQKLPEAERGFAARP